MTLVRTAELVAYARSAGQAVGAFNVICLEHAEAIVAGAEEAGLPVIMQVSENAVKYHHNQLGPIAATCAAVGQASSASVALHLDHVEDLQLVERAPDHQFSSVMFDASRLPHPDNVIATRRARQWGHDHGLWIEAELGEVGGKDGAHAPGARTDPREAAEYVASTGVDALAVAVGNSHAMTARTAQLDIALIEEIRAAVDVPLVLHGSSGVGDDELRRAVRAGMAKVNIGTALNIAFTGAVKSALGSGPTIVDPRRYLRPARDKMAQLVASLLTVLNS
jgi:fructose-bisphosphate aldolase class II